MFLTDRTNIYISPHQFNTVYIYKWAIGIHPLSSRMYTNYKAIMKYPLVCKSFTKQYRNVPPSVRKLSLLKDLSEILLSNY